MKYRETKQPLKNSIKAISYYLIEHIFKFSLLWKVKRFFELYKYP